jgi:hypothetical protein
MLFPGFNERTEKRERFQAKGFPERDWIYSNTFENAITLSILLFSGFLSRGFRQQRALKSKTGLSKEIFQKRMRILIERCLKKL